VPDHHRDPIGQLTAAGLDRYAGQLARCLKALETSAPILAHLATIDAELAARPGRSPGSPAA